MSLRRLWRQWSEEALGYYCGKAKRPRKRKCGAREGAGGRWRVETMLRRVVAYAIRVLATRGRFPLHVAAMA